MTPQPDPTPAEIHAQALESIAADANTADGDLVLNMADVESLLAGAAALRREGAVSLTVEQAEEVAAECQDLYEFHQGIGEPPTVLQDTDTVKALGEAAKTIRSLLVLRASAPAPQERTWQPISSAPKDGTRIQIYGRFQTSEEYTRGHAYWTNGTWITTPIDLQYRDRILPELWAPLAALPAPPAGEGA